MSYKNAPAIKVNTAHKNQIKGFIIYPGYSIILFKSVSYCFYKLKPKKRETPKSLSLSVKVLLDFN